jgi:TatD DNase family protein
VLVDTHCHLGDAKFDVDRPHVVERARAAGVEHIVIIADSKATSERAIALATVHGLSATAGVHPHEALSWSPAVADVIEQSLADPTVVAVGETGLDYHYDHAPRDTQRDAFARQLEFGGAIGKPVVVHARSADEDIVAMLKDSDATVVLHSFSSGPDVLRAGLDRGDYISFSGMVTFKSWADVEAVRSVPADRILVETDSPYLAPVPHRGKRNEPAYITHVVERVAEIRQVPFEQFAAQTTANAARCFGSRITLHLT